VKRHPEPIDPEKIYTLDGLAVAVGSSRRTIQGWIRQGLPSVKNGQRVFIVGSDFADWIRSKKAKK
jgi:phage terminase Nu1 subunit (DNA packaging protein)